MRGRLRESVGESGRDVRNARLLTASHGALGDVNPLMEHLLSLRERLQRLVDQAVVGQHDALGPERGKTAQAGGGLFQVEVGRRGGRPEDAEIWQLTPTASPTRSVPVCSSRTAWWCLA